ncbi:MAG: ComEC/Rec2 family competence protein [Candidatus Buchananbacteria bacterium]|nr:ComEC/Rec2 family competence protein [Candidatus Buchananbacteria bacterium]
MINRALSNSQAFLLAVLGFLAGITTAEFFQLDYFFIFCLGLFFIFLFLMSSRYFRARIIILVALFFILGFWRFQISLPDFDNPDNIYHYNGQPVYFTGRVENIEKKINYQQLILRVVPGNDNFSRGLVVTTLSLFPEYKYGDILKVSCHLKTPDNYNNFDYGRYLSRFNVYATCYYPSVLALSYDQNNFKIKLFSIIYDVKSKLSRNLDFFVSEPESSLLQAMILDAGSALPKDVSSVIANVGLSHVIAISGMHMVLITVIIMQLSMALGLIRQKSFWVAFTTVIFYVAMIGFPASAVRGAIMALLFLYAQKIGRLSYSVNALLLSAFVMLLFNPKLLLSDVGFQLSFTAVLGLLYLLPILKEKLRHWPEFWQMKNIFITTLAAQIMTQPLIILYFQKVSLVSIVANILVLPFVSFLMIWVFINLIVSLAIFPLGYIMGYVSYFITHYIIFISRFLNSWPAAYFKVGLDSLFLTVILYILIVLYIFKNKRYSIDN